MLKTLSLVGLAVATGVILSGCAITPPKGIEPVKQFSMNQYLGTWYEIARLNHSFEKGLTNVTANYSMREDGGVTVVNRGYSEKDQAWDEAEGKAYFVKDPQTGHFKVSFFGPFYGAYVIFNLDDDYQYSLVTGPGRSFFWLLSRTPELTEQKKAELIDIAAKKGFDTEKLIFVDQSKHQG
ncbi:lipocalin family protein [Marinomonas atlantica]|uniref:lipocalin family protein n=1 Tax=Marinomonas atlantica TaxID=1806668 RepID=UPI000833472F|nr:lipocalin family protein [Marinomonas atlantica]MCO4786038.1 lipocalin family protein [Marinomonas atlantica]